MLWAALKHRSPFSAPLHNVAGRRHDQPQGRGERDQDMQSFLSSKSGKIRIPWLMDILRSKMKGIHSHLTCFPNRVSTHSPAFLPLSKYNTGSPHITFHEAFYTSQKATKALAFKVALFTRMWLRYMTSEKHLLHFILIYSGKEVTYKLSCFITGLKNEFLYPKMPPIVNSLVGLKSSQKNTSYHTHWRRWLWFFC